MAWFEIDEIEIRSNDTNPWGEHNRWGLFIGGRWCLDYTWKLYFGISTEDWNAKIPNLKTNQDFYDFCDWLGVKYKKDGKIYKKGKEVGI